MLKVFSYHIQILPNNFHNSISLGLKKQRRSCNSHIVINKNFNIFQNLTIFRDLLNFCEQNHRKTKCQRIIEKSKSFKFKSKLQRCPNYYTLICKILLKTLNTSIKRFCFTGKKVLQLMKKFELVQNINLSNDMFTSKH